MFDLIQDANNRKINLVDRTFQEVVTKVCLWYGYNPHLCLNWPIGCVFSHAVLRVSRVPSFQLLDVNFCVDVDK